MEKRKIFYFFLAAVFIIIIYNYFTSIDNKEISTSETVVIKGTLVRPITKTEIARGRTRLYINIKELPKAKFYISHEYINGDDFKYRILPYGENDSINITTLKQYSQIEEGLIPIYSLTLNGQTFLSLKQRNEIWKSNYQINMLGLKLIASFLIIIAILNRLNIFKRLSMWYEKLNALR